MTEDRQALEQRPTRPSAPQEADADLNGRSSASAARSGAGRWVRWLAGLTGVGLVAGAGWYAGTTATSGATEVAPEVATGTAAVVRTDLTQTERVDGTLGYADPMTVIGQSQGTVTWLAPEGRVVGRGETLYEVNARPVQVMYGSRPMWRALGEGDEGPDVRQLEGNLAELGYDPDAEMTIDQEFTAATAEAVERWQADRGVEETGVVEVGEAIFAPNEVRVGAHRAQPFAPAQGELMEVTSTARVVSVDMETSRQGQVGEGDEVTVELPDGSTTPGQVAEVGSVAQAPPGDEQGDADPTIAVEVTLDQPEDAGTLDQAPVAVNITTATAEDVLAVPVHALVALAEGGYAVEVEQDGERSLVAVETGLFADSQVEVSGEAITEGTEVVVPA